MTVSPDQSSLPKADANRSHTRRDVLILIAVCAGLFGLQLASLPLADPEESRSALVGQDIVDNGRWLAPEADGEVYSKPPPFFWLAAVIMKATGDVELSGRLVAAIAGLAAVLVTYAFARSAFGPTAGLVAGLVLATAGEFLFLARWYRMEMPLTAAIWASMWCFWRAEQRRREDPTVSRRAGWIGFYAFAGVATLLKGPVGLFLPAVVVGAYLVLSRQIRRLRDPFNLLGLGVFVLIATPLYVAMAMNNPGHTGSFFLKENLMRYFISGAFTHRFPGVLYVGILLAGLLPWTVYLPGAFIRLFPWRWRRRTDEPALLFCWLAALLPLLFFAFSSTKIPSYILPCFPPLAVLIGGLLGRWMTSDKPDRLLVHGRRALLAMVLIKALLPLGIEAALGNLDMWIALPIAAAIIAAGMMIMATRRGRRQTVVWVAVAAVVVVELFTLGHTAPAGFEQMSTKSLAARVPAGSDATVCFWANRKLSFLLYSDSSDFAAFKERQPHGLTQLVDLMTSAEDVYCLVTGEKRLISLRAACPLPLTILGQAGECWLVTNRPPVAP